MRLHGVLIGVALLSLTGLSACAEPKPMLDEVTSVTSEGPQVVLHLQRPGTTQLWTVDDNGHPGRATTPISEPKSSDCARTICYRVVPGKLRVEQSNDTGTSWTIAWGLSDDEYQKLAAKYPELGDPAVHLSSRSVVVHAVSNGHVVFVANGRDGLLYRDATGKWIRKGFPRGGEGYYFDEPQRLSTGPEPPDITPYAVVAVGLLMLIAGFVAGAVRRRLTARRSALITLTTALSAAVTYGLCQIPDVGMFPGAFFTVMGIALVILVGLVAVILIATRRPQ